MKIQSFLLALFLGLGPGFPASVSRAQDARNASARVTLRLEPEIDCPGCEDRIKDLLTKARGVQRVDLDLMTNRIAVRYDPAKCTVNALLGRVAATGYKAIEVK